MAMTTELEPVLSTTPVAEHSPCVIGHRKTYCSESFAGVGGSSDILRAEGAIIRHHHDQNISAKTCIVAWKAVGEPRYSSSGVLAWQPS